MHRQHAYVDLTHESKGFVAQCSCGWLSAPSPNAALAGASLDDHVARAATTVDDGSDGRAALAARVEAQVLLREATAAVARARHAGTAAGVSEDYHRLLHAAAEALAVAALHLDDDGAAPDGHSPA